MEFLLRILKLFSLTGLLLLCVANVSADPLTINVDAKLEREGASTNDSFGRTLAIDGNIAVIGSNTWSNIGASYIYSRNEAGDYNLLQQLDEPAGSAEDDFGYSVAISGDTAVIGAPKNDVNGANSGAAYIFVRNETGVWEHLQMLDATDGEADGNFGYSVAISGNTAVIGAPYNGASSTSSGSAYIFAPNEAGVWEQKQKLDPTDIMAGDNFGYSVAISGDTAVIGAPNNDVNGTSSGATYIFIRNDAGVWELLGRFVAGDGTSHDFFGFSVAIDESVMVAGAVFDEDGGIRSGSAYVFVRDEAGIWIQRDKLVPFDGADHDFFGFSAMVLDDLVFIGSPNDETSNTRSGSVYVFLRDATSTWSPQAKLIPFDGATNDQFGISVAAADNSALIGAMTGYTNETRSGAAYVYNLRTGTAVIGTDGGSVSTLEGSVTMTIPPGALDEDTTISISDSGSIFELTIDAGQGLAAYGVDIQPEGTTFSQPVELVFRWRDNDNDGWVDDVDNIREDNLRITKNGESITSICRNEPDACDTAANTFTITITSLSEFDVVVPLDSDNDGIYNNFENVTDTCPYENATGFDSDTDGCIDNLRGFAQILETLVAEGVISTAMHNSLLSKIANAYKSTEIEFICAAHRELDALKNQIKAESSNKISDEAALLLIKYINNLITQ